MEEKLVHKLITKFKDKVSKNKTSYPSLSDYAFSTEELEDLKRENKQKIQELKQDVFSKKKELVIKHELAQENLLAGSEDTMIDSDSNSDVLEENQENDNIHFSSEAEKQTKETTVFPLEEQSDSLEKTTEESTEEMGSAAKNSFVNLSLEYQNIVMSKWMELDSKQIDKDIMDGKELLNHNYTITYADEAAKFIHLIRKRYEVVICYLIGFNNEKKGIYDKTIFSSRIDDEWKFLNQYIKVLEKIRSFRK